MPAPMPANSATGPGDSDVDLGALTGSVGFLLRMAQVRVYEQFFDAFAGTDVKPGELTVLWVIALNPGLRQGSLARVLNIKPAHMTKLVQRLVRSNLVRRSVPEEDRRSVLLELTGHGHAYFERHRPTFLTVHDAEAIGLTDAETRQLLGLLQKLAFKETP